MSPGDLNAVLADVAGAMAPHRGSGQVATYIPALAEADPNGFAIAAALTDGTMASAGDATAAFSIQSISKVFTLTMALESAGAAVWHRVGCEPSGTPFNSIVQLERENGIPRNPFVNAGAIAITDLLLAERGAAAACDAILGFVRQVADDPSIAIDAAIARSEAEHGARNASLAHFMKSFGTLTCPVEDALHVYFHQCAITMTCRQLARAGLHLAAGGTDPLTGQRLAARETVQAVNALMLTCGHYDASGDFAVRIGLPGKSGVGGGILAVVPGEAAVAVWSPGLNANGNSLVGTLALEDLARRTGWSLFRSTPM